MKPFDILETFGAYYLLVCVFAWNWIFFTAYFNPGKKVTLYIDILHEAHLEAILCTLGILCVFFFFWKNRKKKHS